MNANYYSLINYSSTWMPLTTATTTTTDIQIRTISGAQYQVDWGDGSITTHNSDDVANKTYSSPYAGVIKVRALSGGLININKLQITAGNWNFDISTLKYYVPNLTYLRLLSNSSTWSGDIADVPSGLTTLYLNSITSTWTYTAGRVWSNMTNLYLRPKAGVFTSTMSDNLFIDLDASPLVTGAGTIDLRGNCGAVTSASLTERNSLVTKGKTLLFN